MARFLINRLKTKGQAPGSLIFLGEQKMEKIRMSLFRYNEETLEEKDIAVIGPVLASMDDQAVHWINIDGVHDASLFQEISGQIGVSSLALEDIMNTDQRPKLFEDMDTLTLICKAIYYNREEKTVNSEQISFILGKNFLISFQERTGDHFEGVRNRLRQKIGRIRLAGADYLMYALVDALVDNYLIDIEAIGSEIEKIETRLVHPDKDISNEIFHLKKEVIFLRKTILPHKELFTKLLRSNSTMISSHHLVYYQELYDLIQQAQEACDSFFNLVVDQMNIYNTHISSKANDIMKVLTIFASIFIPLTFLTGVYGTNFDNLPELHLRFGYFFMWGVMVVMTIGMLLFFKHRKWF